MTGDQLDRREGCCSNAAWKWQLGVGLFAAILDRTCWVFYDGALLILIGFAVAGAIHVIVDPDRIVRHLGARSLGAAARAALLGAPLPLCSCGVLPTATLLRRKGASREAILSLLISTPETGIDAMSITVAFFGPVLALIRPLVAIATALVAAGLSLRTWPPGTDVPGEPQLLSPELDGVLLSHHHDLPQPSATILGRANALVAQLKLGLRHGFTELFDELAFSLTFAMVLTGVLSAVLPDGFFRQLSASSVLGMTAMAALSIPLYVCASASTPIAALFVSKGASVGGALVFLLVGPATNFATLATVARLLGRRSLRLYVGTIIGMAVAAGLAVDLLLPDIGKGLVIGPSTEREPLSVLKVVAALTLIGLLGMSLRRTGIGPGMTELAANARAAARWLGSLDARRAATSWPVVAFLILLVSSEIAQGFIVVPTGQQAVITRLGKVLAPPKGAGLGFALPWIDRVQLIRVDEVREVPVGYRIGRGSLSRDALPEEALYVTADENVIDLHAVVLYRVSDAVRFAIRVEHPDQALSRLMRGRLVEAMAGRPIDAVYTSDRKSVEAWLQDRLRSDAGDLDLGIEILAVRLLDVHAPTNVHDAFRDVASAHEDQLTTIHRANQYAVGAVNVARGEADRVVAEAESWAMQRKAKASGDASAFTALAAEHRRAPRVTEDRLYLESAERALAGVPKLVRPAAKSLHGYEIWLRKDGSVSIPGPPATAKPSAPRDEATASAEGEPSRAWMDWAPETANGDAK